MFSNVDAMELAFKRLTGSRLGMLSGRMGRLEVTTLNEHMARLIEAGIDFNPARLRMTQAMFEPATESIVFFSDRIQAGHEEAVILHELVHKNAHKVLTPKDWRGLVDVLQSWAHAPSESLARQVYDWASGRALDDTRGRAGVFEEELFAYGVEACVRMGVKPMETDPLDQPQGWLSRARAVIQKVVDAQLGHGPAEISPQDLVDLAYAFARIEAISPNGVDKMLTPKDAPAQSSLPAFPMAHRDEWYGEGTYLANGGRLVGVSPERFLSSVRPLTIDEESRENIDALKAHILAGKTLDPLLIRADGKEDGRHRAHAAAELGIQVVPVIAFGEQLAGAPDYPEVEQPASTQAMTDSLRRAMSRTDTPEFRAWFAQSKVVDSTGQPLVVYHGTTRSIDNGVFRDAVSSHMSMAFFTDSPVAAGVYARNFGRGYVEGSQILPVYLSFQNPKVIDFGDQEDDRDVRAEVYLAQDEGYDSLIVLNAYDGRSVTTQYVSFGPSQIKSAIGNAGTFDPNSPHINRRAMRVVATPEFANWFKGSKVLDPNGDPLLLFHGTRRDFDTFKPSNRDLGIHFGSAEQASSQHFVGNKPRLGGRVLPVYLSIKNPLRLIDTFRPGPGALLDISDQLVCLGLMSDEEQDHLLERLADSAGSAGVGKAYKTLVAAIERAGYDGVVYANMCEGDVDPELQQKSSVSNEELLRPGNDSWIAFRPEQIKSAIGNRGEFRPDDPSILNSLGEPPEELESTEDFERETP